MVVGQRVSLASVSFHLYLLHRDDHDHDHHRVQTVLAPIAVVERGWLVDDESGQRNDQLTIWYREVSVDECSHRLVQAVRQQK